jgi:Zn-finger nucleic acid-binding protein
MKCPVCKTIDLLMTERRSIEIDYCPQCRGVWLDRGELDKLIAQDVGEADAPSTARAGREERRDRGNMRMTASEVAATTIIGQSIERIKRSARSSICSTSTERAGVSVLYRARLYRRLRRAACLYSWTRRR